MPDVTALSTALSAIDALLARASDNPIEFYRDSLAQSIGDSGIDRSSLPMTANLLELGNITSPEALAAAKIELTALLTRESVKPEKPSPKRPARQVSRRGRP